jgi:hypothetical protein
VNVPLKAGIGDESYRVLFAQVISGVVARYSPKAVVLQWYFFPFVTLAWGGAVPAFILTATCAQAALMDSWAIL